MNAASLLILTNENFFKIKLIRGVLITPPLVAELERSDTQDEKRRM